MWQTQMLIQSTSKFSSQPSRARPLQVLSMGCSQDGPSSQDEMPCDVSNYTITVLFQMHFSRRMVTCAPSASSTRFVHKDAPARISWHKSRLKKATDTHPWFRYFRSHLWEIYVRKCFCSFYFCTCLHQCVSWEHHVEMLVTVVHYFGLQFFKVLL